MSLLVQETSQAQQLADQRYIDLLENVNSQLSLTWTPWSITFTALAILITVLTIGGAILFAFQSSQYRKDLKAAIDRFQLSFDEIASQHKVVIETLVGEKRAEISQMIESIDQLRLKEAGAEGTEREQLERRLAKMEKRLGRLVINRDDLTDAAERVFNAASAAGESPAKWFSEGLRKVSATPGAELQWPPRRTRGYTGHPDDMLVAATVKLLGSPSQVSEFSGSLFASGKTKHVATHPNMAHPNLSEVRIWFTEPMSYSSATDLIRDAAVKAGAKTPTIRGWVRDEGRIDF